jgi:hypothetical protein
LKLPPQLYAIARFLEYTKNKNRGSCTDCDDPIGIINNTNL